MDVFEPEYIGRTVRIKNTMLYNDQIGILEPKSDRPEDFWDYNVRLESGRRIGVHTSQFILIQEEPRQCEAMHWYAENHGVTCKLEWGHELEGIDDHQFD